MKKRFRYCACRILLLPLCLIITSCGNAPQGSTPPADVTRSDMWRVELHSAELADSLTATLAAVQYGGGILETTSEVKPAAGNTFLLLELTIEKVGTGKASFSWSDAHIEDSAGNVYYRHANDTFLANLNIPRLKGTDIVFGNEYGYVCFEIPQSAEGLFFAADEGKIVIEVDT